MKTAIELVELAGSEVAVELSRDARWEEEDDPPPRKRFLPPNPIA